MAVATKLVRFSSGKFKGQEMTINADNDSVQYAREHIGDFTALKRKPVFVDPPEVKGEDKKAEDKKAKKGK